jgi:hypothetical protein
MPQSLELRHFVPISSEYLEIVLGFSLRNNHNDKRTSEADGHSGSDHALHAAAEPGRHQARGKAGHAAAAEVIFRSWKARRDAGLFSYRAPRHDFSASAMRRPK